MLRTARREVTKGNIQKLREGTAELMYTAYVNDLEVHGVKAREIVQKSGDTLRAYLAKLRWQLWASPLEVCLAADVMNVQVAVSVGNGIITHGSHPRHLVRLTKEHYMLHAMRTPVARQQRVPTARGGMQSPFSCSVRQQQSGPTGQHACDVSSPVL